jgi:phosphoglycerol transferase MdoB-like AlkP superfamily enzyme/glycerophosphoryl diester phosphodiesterase
MQMKSTEPVNVKTGFPNLFILRAFMWSILWGVGIGVLKLFIFHVQGVDITPGYYTGMFASLPGNVFIGMAIGLLLFYPGSVVIRACGYLSGTLLFLYESFASHYELVFGSLPNSTVFYYLKELKHLAPSLQSVAPFGVFLIEGFLGCVLLVLCVMLVRLIPVSRKAVRKLTLLVLSAIMLCGASMVALNVDPRRFTDPSFFKGSRNSLVWLLLPGFQTEPQAGSGNLNRFNILKFKHDIGHKNRTYTHAEEFPLYSENDPAPNDSSRKNSIIILILESVGNKELFSEKEGRALMPNLRSIAKDNLFFENTYAAGTKSNQVLPSLFAGVLPQTHRNILWREPLPTITGLPERLRAKQYRTAYFHGSDLSFEQQREFLQMVGFEEIFDYDHDLEQSVAGWGYDDATMLSVMTNWILGLGEEERPYLSTLFTLSTHDPFTLPRSWNPLWRDHANHLDANQTWQDGISVKERFERFQESLYFLDYHLGEFYNWYLNEEKPKGTILVLLGDHAPSIYNEAPDIQGRHMRFSVPLIIAGLHPDLERNYRSYTGRRASQYDIPATLTRLLGLVPLPSDQGLDLFMSSEDWPDNRIVYAVGGQNLERIYMWTDECQAAYDRMVKSIKAIDHEVPDGFISSKPEIARAVVKNRLVPFLNALLPLDIYLYNNGAYEPGKPNEKSRPVKPYTVVKKPIFISHRGNVYGKQEAIRENKPKAIEDAIAAGFDWIEVDIQMTRDSVPILLHDPKIRDRAGNSITISELTFESLKKMPGYADTITLEEAIVNYGRKARFLFEIKPMYRVDRSFILNRQVANLIRKYKLQDRVIVDSFQSLTASFIKNRCDCQVGIDTPYRQKPSEVILDTIARKNLDWVYIHHSVIDKALIQRIHDQGLQVMAYTVNDPAILSQWAGNFPDGVITDTIELKKAFLKSFRDEG